MWPLGSDHLGLDPCPAYHQPCVTWGKLTSKCLCLSLPVGKMGLLWTSSELIFTTPWILGATSWSRKQAFAHLSLASSCLFPLSDEASNTTWNLMTVRSAMSLRFYMWLLRKPQSNSLQLKLFSSWTHVLWQLSFLIRQVPLEEEKLGNFIFFPHLKKLW